MKYQDQTLRGPTILSEISYRYKSPKETKSKPLYAWGQLFTASLYSRGRTGLVVRASDSGSGDPGSILGRVGVLFP